MRQSRGHAGTIGSYFNTFVREVNGMQCNKRRKIYIWEWHFNFIFTFPISGDE